MIWKEHARPEWTDSDRSSLENFLKSKTGKKYYKIIECAVRTQFECMANSKTNEDTVFYKGNARGLSISLIITEQHRIKDAVKVSKKDSELNIEELAQSEPAVYE